MKKVLAIVMALVLVVALSVNVFADEKVVYDNAAGEQPADCANAWDFFGICGSTWGRTDVCDVTVEDFVAMCTEGGWTFSYVYSGTPSNFGVATNPDANPQIAINADFDNGIQMTHVDLGDGKYEASIALDDMLAAYGSDASTITSVCVQLYTGDFKIYSAKFTNGSDTVAATPAPEVATTTDTTTATETTSTPETTTTAPETGLALAVVPAVIALAAAVVSRKH